MARCYSVFMPKRHPSLRSEVPDIWLVTDKRNDATLERALARLPRGSGLIFRHYHLDPGKRRARFTQLARAARARGHVVVLSGSARMAKNWGADGVYGPPDRICAGPALLRLATVHSLHEIGKAQSGRADAVVLSPVYPTRSHPGASGLGPVKFRLLARHATAPAIALGGMNRQRAARLACAKWAAIDSFCAQPTRGIPKDS